MPTRVAAYGDCGRGGSHATGGPRPSLSAGACCGHPDLLTVPSGAWVWLPGVIDRSLTWSHQRRGLPSHVSWFRKPLRVPRHCFHTYASHFRETSEGVGNSGSGQSGTSEGGIQNNLRGDGLEVESCARLYCNVKICTYVRVYTGQFTQTHERA